jgi:hypothetical protein
MDPLRLRDSEHSRQENKHNNCFCNSPGEGMATRVRARAVVVRERVVQCSEARMLGPWAVRGA